MEIKKLNWAGYAVRLISAWALLGSPSLSAQPVSDKQLPSKVEPPTDCESALMYLDAAMSQAQKDSEGYIILIVHLGDGEKSQVLNLKRLNAAKKYITERTRSKVTAAYGERAKGRGRLEIYVAGKVFQVLTYPRNGHIDCRGLG